LVSHLETIAQLGRSGYLATPGMGLGGKSMQPLMGGLHERGLV